MSQRRGMRPGRVMSVWMLILGHFCGDRLLRSGSSSVSAELPDIIKMSAVTGGEAALPCYTHPPQPSDSLLLVAWYKNDVPMYSYDGRVKGPAAHWADDTLTGRAYWHDAEPSVLELRDVIPTDRALYRCRVDFKISPTLNQKIQLDVIELPEKPKIFDETDKEVIGLAGPYVEDTSVKLTCVVSGGNPMPRVRWWRDDKVVTTLPPVNDGSRLSALELRIPQLTREYHHVVYSCTAENTALVMPLRTNVQLQLHLRPLLVEILSRDQPLSVQQKADIVCRTVGSQPPAEISWWLDNERLTSAEQKTTDNQNETLSVLRWTPLLENNGQVLACRASHPVLKQFAIESNFTLDLHYVPIVHLRLGHKLNPEDIEEGDDVYFECAVRANPPAYKVVWENNGQPMAHNQRAGVIAGSAHLALQRVSREQSGQYSCTASNVEGDGRSLPVTLQVIYKPECKSNSMTIVGATINTEVEVVCKVDAYPRPTNFQWIINNSLGSFEQESDKFTITEQGSTFFFTPKAEADFGTIACKATNLAGQQVEPCLYTLISATRPERLHNCSATNMTNYSIDLRCVAGYDGGQQSEHIVEVWEADGLLLNVSSPKPVWKLQGIGSGKALRLIFYSHNSKGRSDKTKLRVHTPPRMSFHTESNSSTEAELTWILGTLLGLAGAVILFLVVIMVARKRSHQSEQNAGPIGTKAYNSTGSCHHSPMPDDKNPDVVPLAKGLAGENYSEMSPKPPPYGVTPPSPLSLGLSKSTNSLLREVRPNAVAVLSTPASGAQSLGSLSEDRRSVTSGTLPRRREIVTTRTPLLANTRESCV